MSSNFTNTSSSEIPAAVVTIRKICIGIWISIILFGVIGNILTVMVLQYPKMNTMSTPVYLRALAAVDMIFLIFSLGGQLIDFMFFFPMQLRQQHAFFCHFVNMTGFSITYMSVWLLVFVTVDRMFWVIFPFKARKMCTIKTAKYVITSICIFCILINTHFAWTVSFQLSIYSNNTICEWSYPTFKLLFPIFDLVLVNILPSIIMLVANILIIAKLHQMKMLRRKMKEGNSAARRQTETEVDNDSKSNNFLKPPEIIHIVRHQQEKIATTQKLRDKKASNLTKMLMTTNVFFVLSTLPLLIYDLIYWFIDVNMLIKADEQYYGPLLFGLEKLVYTLWYLHFSMHFLLYCMSGPKFRYQALSMLGIRRTNDDVGLDRGNVNQKGEREHLMIPLGASEILSTIRKSISISNRS